MFKKKYSSRPGFSFKLFFKIALSLCVAAIVILFSMDFFKFKKIYKENSKQLVTDTVNEILQLNINLRSKISHLLIKNQELLIKLSKDPEDTKLIDKINQVFKAQLSSFYNFSLADQHGTLVTDIFFEQVGRLCRQDIKAFAVNQKHTWLTIHPGVGQYHYDLILPWEYGGEKRIMFISFYIDDLVKILKNNQRPSHELFIVRKDKNNLIELSSSGSRADQNNTFFLTDKQLQAYSKNISGTYWTIVELPEVSIFAYYMQEVWYKKAAQLWFKYFPSLSKLSITTNIQQID
ncbi:MAG: hypothetical protein QM479_00310 [Pseudomonadota bacterium]